MFYQLFYQPRHLITLKLKDMATAKVILRTDKPNAKGECPLYIRFISLRKTSYQSLGKYIDPKHWDKSSSTVKTTYKNSSRLNAFIANALADSQGIILEADIKKQPTTSKRLKEKFGGKVQNPVILTT
jgi:integrase/recombinase XerD